MTAALSNNIVYSKGKTQSYAELRGQWRFLHETICGVGGDHVVMNSVRVLMSTHDVSPDTCTNNRAASKQGLSRLGTGEWHCVATLVLLKSAVASQ